MKNRIEWPTIALIVLCTVLLVLVSFFASAMSLWLAVPVLSVLLTLHSSLQHEVLHGHPFRHRRFNEALVSIPFGIFVPYGRFRDLHLVHHQDALLTDPYDDPESNYLDPAVWHQLPGWLQTVLNINNTLMGRMLIGPLIGLICFYRADFAAIWRGERDVLHAYLAHCAGLAIWLWWLGVYSSVPQWAYWVAAYVALSLLRVRTFLEHQAHVDVPGRTVIIEDRGIFAFLFLNNNFHLVHHMHPGTPWYQLPALYQSRREHFVQRNQGYVFPRYRSIFARFLFKRKDPVPHPLWPDQLPGRDASPRFHRWH